MASLKSPSIPVTGPTSLLAYAEQLGMIGKGVVFKEVGFRQQEFFMTAVMRLGKEESEARKSNFEEERKEQKLAREFGVLDVGQDSENDYELGGSGILTPDTAASEWRSSLFLKAGSKRNTKEDTPLLSGGCFKAMCKTLGLKVSSSVHSVSDLDASQVADLATSKDVYIACVVYGNDDSRNHVMAANKVGKAGSLQVQPVDRSLAKEAVTYVLTNPQEFFNAGGRFYNTKFYADNQEVEVGETSVEESAPAEFSSAEKPRVVGRRETTVETFGGDAYQVGVAPTFTERSHSGFVGDRRMPPPVSVVDEREFAGSNNTTGGVVRAKRRVVKGMNTFEDGYRVRKNYQVASTTLFNNVDELYLNVISKDYAQEIMEELFSQWGLPTDQPDTMRYAEDLFYAFLVARTASNKADYNSEFEIPTQEGEVLVSFSRFSALLADKYGITRRNFTRGSADDIRAYLNRPENQLVKSRSAQRVGSDPQYGDLCFDGSTGCTNLTSSEMTFCRLLESRNLYERDDLIAEGASEKLMQGIHGGVRSVVSR